MQQKQKNAEMIFHFCVFKLCKKAQRIQCYAKAAKHYGKNCRPQSQTIMKALFRGFVESTGKNSRSQRQNERQRGKYRENHYDVGKAFFPNVAYELRNAMRENSERNFHYGC